MSEEQMWLDYNFEEAQVKIDLADMLLETLMGETVELVGSIRK
jgi:hypothetical protein